MKAAKTLIFVFILGFWSFSLAQDGELTASDVIFYESLAERDAIYEQEQRFSNEKDERDYWRDQKNFEIMLLQKNPQAYHVYISKKRPSYVDHIEHCHPDCGHGDFYKREEASFLMQMSNDSIYGRLLSEAQTRTSPYKFK